MEEPSPSMCTQPLRMLGLCGRYACEQTAAALRAGSLHPVTLLVLAALAALAGVKASGAFPDQVSELQVRCTLSHTPRAQVASTCAG